MVFEDLYQLLLAASCGYSIISSVLLPHSQQEHLICVISKWNQEPPNSHTLMIWRSTKMFNTRLLGWIQLIQQPLEIVNACWQAGSCGAWYWWLFSSCSWKDEHLIKPQPKTNTVAGSLIRDTMNGQWGCSYTEQYPQRKAQEYWSEQFAGHPSVRLIVGMETFSTSNSKSCFERSILNVLNILMIEARGILVVTGEKLVGFNKVLRVDWLLFSADPFLELLGLLGFILFCTITSTKYRLNGSFKSWELFSFII